MKDVNVLRNAGANIEKSLELLGDMDMYNEVLGDFLGMIDEKISLLNKYKSINDMANYAIEVHALKSDVRYLGFMALGDMAYELELDSKNNDLVSVSSKHDNLINETNKVVNACKTYYYGSTTAPVTETQATSTPVDASNLDPMSQALMYQGNAVSNNANTMGPKNGVILIVDDSQITANFIRKVFESNYDVYICPEGQTAINYLAFEENRAKVKACLLDLNMPGVDGFDVLNFLKSNNFFVKLPVVVITGVENVDIIAKAKTYPIVEVLAKPFNERDAVDAVNKCLATYF